MTTDRRNIKPNLIFSVLLISALIIQTFSYSLPFYDGLVDGGGMQILINSIYTYRDICLFSTIGIILYYVAIPKDSIILLISSILAIIISFVVHEQNAKYFQDVQTAFILCINVYLIIRSNLINIDIFKKVLRLSCYILAPLAIFAFFTQQRTLLFLQQYMDYSNAVSIVTALLLYFGIIENKRIDFALGFITYVILLIAGGRGAFLTLSLLIVSLIWLKYQNKKLLYIVFFLCIIILIFPDIILQILLFLSSSVDFESRNIERLLTSEVLKGNDRYQLYGYLFERILNDFFIGGGICADRYYLDIGHLTDNGYYAHNILIEWIVDFGILGLILFCYVIKLIYKFVCNYYNQKEICGFLFVYISISFIQLFFSRSWLTEPNLFVLIGLLIHYNYEYDSFSNSCNTNIQK